MFGGADVDELFDSSMMCTSLCLLAILSFHSHRSSRFTTVKCTASGSHAPTECLHALQKRTKGIVEDISAKYSSTEAAEVCENHPSATLAPPTPRHYNPTYQVFPHPSNPHIVMDARVMPRLLTQLAESAVQTVGIITNFEVNRKGGLSCPVRTGAVLACCRSPSTSIMHGAAADCIASSGSGVTVQSQASDGFVLEPSSTEASVSETTREACAQTLDELETEGLSALRTCDSFGSLKQLITGGQLPSMHAASVHRSHSFFQGVTVEFDPPKHGFSKVRLFQPRFSGALITFAYQCFCLDPAMLSSPSFHDMKFEVLL